MAPASPVQQEGRDALPFPTTHICTAHGHVEREPYTSVSGSCLLFGLLRNMAESSHITPHTSSFTQGTQHCLCVAVSLWM